MRFHPSDLVVEDKPSAAGLCATTAVAAQSSVSGALAQLGPTGRDVIAWVLPSSPWACSRHFSVDTPSSPASRAALAVVISGGCFLSRVCKCSQFNTWPIADCNNRFSESEDSWDLVC